MTCKDFLKCRANDVFWKLFIICLFGEMTPLIFRGSAATPQKYGHTDLEVICQKSQFTDVVHFNCASGYCDSAAQKKTWPQRYSLRQLRLAVNPRNGGFTPTPHHMSTNHSLAILWKKAISTGNQYLYFILSISAISAFPIYAFFILKMSAVLCVL